MKWLGNWLVEKFCKFFLLFWIFLNHKFKKFKLKFFDNIFFCDFFYKLHILFFSPKCNFSALNIIFLSVYNVFRFHFFILFLFFEIRKQISKKMQVNYVKNALFFTPKILHHHVFLSIKYIKFEGIIHTKEWMNNERTTEEWEELFSLLYGTQIVSNWKI